MIDQRIAACAHVDRPRRCLAVPAQGDARRDASNAIRRNGIGRHGRRGGRSIWQIVAIRGPHLVLPGVPRRAVGVGHPPVLVGEQGLVIPLGFQVHDSSRQNPSGVTDPIKPSIIGAPGGMGVFWVEGMSLTPLRHADVGGVIPFELVLRGRVRRGGPCLTDGERDGVLGVVGPLVVRARHIAPLPDTGAPGDGDVLMLRLATISRKAIDDNGRGRSSTRRAADGHINIEVHHKLINEEGLHIFLEVQDVRRRVAGSVEAAARFGAPEVRSGFAADAEHVLIAQDRSGEEDRELSAHAMPPVGLPGGSSRGMGDDSIIVDPELGEANHQIAFLFGRVVEMQSQSSASDPC